MKPQHIIVGLSGGVDSSIAAYLLKEAGHQVTGVFMKNWEGDDSAAHCPAEQDLADAQAVCDRLHIPLQFVNFADQYWERVFTYFLDEYRAGRTPNPDVLCNAEIKFRAFLDYAQQNGADYIATGHYAQIYSGTLDHKIYLAKGADANKDQSYFLHALTKEQLAKSLFPIGAMQKTAVRDLAKQLGLSNHAKKDSTGICFIGERRFKQFLNDYLPANPGVIETERGEAIGRHDGLMFYTIGQRQGLQIGGRRSASGEASTHHQAWYVAAKDLARNVLVVVQGDHHPLLFKSSLIASKLHWIQQPPAFPATLMAKIRYRQDDQACIVHILGKDAMRYRIDFATPQRAVTPGQYVVFYQDDICLGGGMIES